MTAERRVVERAEIERQRRRRQVMVVMRILEIGKQNPIGALDTSSQVGVVKIAASRKTWGNRREQPWPCEPMGRAILNGRDSLQNKNTGELARAAAGKCSLGNISLLCIPIWTRPPQVNMMNRTVLFKAAATNAHYGSAQYVSIPS